MRGEGRNLDSISESAPTGIIEHRAATAVQINSGGLFREILRIRAG
jgi:hypothetical protein